MARRCGVTLVFSLKKAMSTRVFALVASVVVARSGLVVVGVVVDDGINALVRVNLTARVDHV